MIQSGSINRGSKIHLVSGHGFGRAESGLKNPRTPEAAAKLELVKGAGFSPYVKSSMLGGALAPEGISAGAILKPALVIFALCAVSVLPARAASGRYAITTERIAAAVSSNGVAVSPDQVTLPANVVARVADPVLKMTSIDRAGDGRATARLECAQANQCLPFIVTLRMTAVPVAMSSPGRSPASTQSKPVPPAVHAGSPATLQLEGAHVHIVLSVTCLENGAIGQTIRATSQDRSKVYIVQVVHEGILEGRL